MKTKGKETLIYVILPIISLILFFSLITIGTEQTIIEGKYTECRDKNNRIIVGVECNDTETKFFGMNEGFILLSFIPLTICLLIIYWKNIFSKNEGVKDDGGF